MDLLKNKDKLEKAIIKHAIINAVQHNNQANPKAIIGKIIAEFPDSKKDMKNISIKINKLTSEVNKLSANDQNKLYEDKFKEDFEQKQEQKKQEQEEQKENMKDLDNVDKKKGVIMRLAPSPSGPMHIGHAITGGLTSLYVKKYGGKFILRIEDTNSDNIYTPAYKLLPEDADWVFGNVTDVWIQSDRLQIYYDYAEKLINLDKVYICTCSQEQFKKYSESMKDCPCRKNTIKQNLELWQKMFDKKKGFKEGEAVVRFKANMQDPNPAMRDFPLVRINDNKHPRQNYKYRVWPLMNLCVTVDDIEAKMTHIIRAKDHADNAKRQKMMYDALGIKKFPETYFLGRWNFEGLEISCSKTKARIEKGEFSGWDDIRVPFLRALRRRGYQPEAFMKCTKLTGLSPVDKTIKGDDFFKMLNAFNKEIIDPIAKRLFIITNKKAIKIKNAPERKIELDLHPDAHKGGRKFVTKDSFYIEKSDYDNIMKNKTKVHRLMDCCNFIVEKDKFVFHSQDYEDYKNAKNRGIILHFLPNDKSNIDIKILDENAKWIKAIAEPSVSKIKQDEIVQFERFAFCKLDNKKNLEFWYGHR